jgi:DNA-binding HxlR family transcriptional regulator
MKMLQESKMVPPILIGRRTPKILFSLKRRPYRHGQLRRHLGSISQRMLTRTLHNLESTGLIARRIQEIEHRRCRVFLDPTRNDDHRPARRYVPLGETPAQAGDC